MEGKGRNFVQLWFFLRKNPALISVKMTHHLPCIYFQLWWGHFCAEWEKIRTSVRVNCRSSISATSHDDVIDLLCSGWCLPSVLWRCWLGSRKGIRPVKNWVVRCWHGYLSGARCRCWCHYHSLSLAAVKSRFVLPFWYRPTRVVLEKGPLNECVCT